MHVLYQVPGGGMLGAENMPGILTVC